MMRSSGNGMYGADGSVAVPGAGQVSRAGVATVFGLLAFSFVMTFIGGFAGLVVFSRVGYGMPAFVVLGIVQIVLVLSLGPISRRAPVIGLGILYLFTFLIGLSLAPLIISYASAGLLGVVGQAVAITAMLTIALMVFGLTTDISLSHLGTWLFVGLMGLLAASVLFIFFRSPILNVLIGAGGSVLFSLYLVYDVQRIRQHSRDMSSAIMLTVAVYLDIVNLFTSILRVLGVLQGGSRRD